MSRHKAKQKPVIARSPYGSKFEMSEAEHAPEIVTDTGSFICTTNCPRCFPAAYAVHHSRHYGTYDPKEIDNAH